MLGDGVDAVSAQLDSLIRVVCSRTRNFLAEVIDKSLLVSNLSAPRVVKLRVEVLAGEIHAR